MQIQVLGPIDAKSGGTAVTISANQRLVIAVLAARAGDVVPADVLIDALWGDALPRNPRGALQNVVSRIRSRLDPADADAVVTRPPGYALGTGRVQIDRDEFLRHVAEARATTAPRAAIEHYDRALRLWCGPPYAGSDAAAIREDGIWLSEVRAMVIEERLAWCVEVDAAAAVAELGALVAVHPYRERLHALLMEALYRTGRQRDALAVFDRYRRTLADEHGLDPSDDLRALEQAILTDTLARRTTGAAAGGPSTVVTNLAPRRTSFVGRGGERSAIGARLEQEPLITLVGVGGAGKTSLALEIARDALDRHVDGAWVVDLLQVTDGDRIPELVATTIGLPALDPAAPLMSLVERLRSKDLLLVLDNCEHLIGAAAGVADAVLDGAPGIRLLATSREALRIPGESVHRMEPLPVPDETGDLDGVLLSASAQLFVDRVFSADDRFRPAPSDAELIRTICRRLDGLPLALELAAARVPSLGLRQVADRLDDRFALLTSDRRGGSRHHQTLRAAIAWSVDLLDDRQRLLLARLSVFAGSFDLVAVEVVCADGALPVHEIPVELSALVDRSLVVADRPGRGVRYRLLETVRAFASVDLGGHSDETRQRHRDWCRGLAHSVGDGFLVRTADWYGRLRAELPNLRAAFDWSLARGDVAEAVDLVAALRWAPMNTGHLYREHRDWVARALGAARAAEVDDESLGRALVAAAAVGGLENRSAEAVAMLDEATALLDRVGSTTEVMWAHMWLGAFLADLGRYAEAVDRAGQGLAIADRIGSRVGSVYLANQRGENAAAASRLIPDEAYEAVASDAYRRAAREAVESGIEEGLIRARHGMAFLTAPQDPMASMAACEEALVGWRDLGAGNRLSLGLVSSARVALLAGDDERVAALLAEAVQTMDRVGWMQPLGRLAETAAVKAAGDGDVGVAAALATAAGKRFSTPRWFVPIDAADRLARARETDPGAWVAAAARGRTLTDPELLAAILDAVGRVVPEPEHAG